MVTSWLGAEAGLRWSQAQQPHSPFLGLQGLANPEADNGHAAARCRQLAEDIRHLFHWEHIATVLPIPVVTPEETPSWPGRHCRSHYQWLPPDDLQTEADFQHLDPFDLLLRLFDFSAWRPLLGQRFRGAKGPPAFDPVSLGLGILLARYQQWSWSQLTSALRSQRGVDYRLRLGFAEDDVPCCLHLAHGAAQHTRGGVDAVCGQSGAGSDGNGHHSSAQHLASGPAGPGCEHQSGQPVGECPFTPALSLSTSRVLVAPWAAQLCRPGQRQTRL